MDPRPGERVLVVGCGTGLDLGLLPPRLRIKAGDVAPAMVRWSRRRDKSLGLDADVRELDAHALDLPPAHYDAVVLHLVLSVMPDPHAAIRVAARVLRPGARAGIFDKFLPDGAQPTVLRRMASAVANALATDLNRQLGPLLRERRLVLERREPAVFRRHYEVALAQRPPA